MKSEGTPRGRKVWKQMSVAWPSWEWEKILMDYLINVAPFDFYGSSQAAISISTKHNCSDFYWYELFIYQLASLLQRIYIFHYSWSESIIRQWTAAGQVGMKWDGCKFLQDLQEWNGISVSVDRYGSWVGMEMKCVRVNELGVISFLIQFCS